VLNGLIGILTSGQLWVHVGSSLYRIGLGFGAAVGVSVLAGLLVARVPPARVALRDLTAVLNSTSVFVWIVLALIWFGLSNSGPVFTTFMIVLPVMLSNVGEGVDSVDRKLLEMAQAYRLSGLDRFRHVTLPSVVPYLVAGMRVSIGDEGLYKGGSDATPVVRARRAQGRGCAADHHHHGGSVHVHDEREDRSRTGRPARRRLRRRGPGRGPARRPSGAAAGRGAAARG
jgi:hypothetical protein